jgi:hypothetical protein
VASSCEVIGNINDFLGEVEAINVLAVEALPEPGDKQRLGKPEDLLKEIQAEAYWGLQRTETGPWGEESRRDQWQGEEDTAGREERDALDLRQTEPAQLFHISVVEIMTAPAWHSFLDRDHVPTKCGTLSVKQVTFNVE